MQAPTTHRPPNGPARKLSRVVTQAVAYLRVSTAEQARSGAGIAAQRSAIERWAAEQGQEIIAWYIDQDVSGSVAPEDRPELARALEDLRTGTGGQLVIAKVDRVSRKLLDLMALIEQARTDGWALTSADRTIDMTTPAGLAMLAMQGVFAQLERDLIRERTRDALAERRAAGVILGRPVEQDASVVMRILVEREAGTRWADLARRLNREGILTPRGKPWQPAGVQQVTYGRLARELAAELAG